jgi:hypothetical protein
VKFYYYSGCAVFILGYLGADTARQNKKKSLLSLLSSLNFIYFNFVLFFLLYCILLVLYISVSVACYRLFAVGEHPNKGNEANHQLLSK